MEDSYEGHSCASGVTEDEPNHIEELNEAFKQHTGHTGPTYSYVDLDDDLGVTQALASGDLDDQEVKERRYSKLVGLTGRRRSLDKLIRIGELHQQRVEERRRSGNMEVLDLCDDETVHLHIEPEEKDEDVPIPISITLSPSPDVANQQLLPASPLPSPRSVSVNTFEEGEKPGEISVIVHEAESRGSSTSPAFLFDPPPTAFASPSLGSRAIRGSFASFKRVPSTANISADDAKRISLTKVQAALTASTRSLSRHSGFPLPNSPLEASPSNNDILPGGASSGRSDGPGSLHISSSSPTRTELGLQTSPADSVKEEFVKASMQSQQLNQIRTRQRLVKLFGQQPPLDELARQNLVGLGNTVARPSATRTAWEVSDSQQGTPMMSSRGAASSGGMTRQVSFGRDLAQRAGDESIEDLTMFSRADTSSSGDAAPFSPLPCFRNTPNPSDFDELDVNDLSFSPVPGASATSGIRRAVSPRSVTSIQHANYLFSTSFSSTSSGGSRTAERRHFREEQEKKIDKIDKLSKRLGVNVDPSMVNAGQPPRRMSDANGFNPHLTPPDQVSLSSTNSSFATSFTKKVKGVVDAVRTRTPPTPQMIGLSPSTSASSLASWNSSRLDSRSEVASPILPVAPDTNALVNPRGSLDDAEAMHRLTTKFFGEDRTGGLSNYIQAVHEGLHVPSTATPSSRPTLCNSSAMTSHDLESCEQCSKALEALSPEEVGLDITRRASIIRAERLSKFFGTSSAAVECVVEHNVNVGLVPTTTAHPVHIDADTGEVRVAPKVTSISRPHPSTTSTTTSTSPSARSQ